MKNSNSIPNIACLVEACAQLGIPYTFYDANHNLASISLDHEYFFANASTPFNDEAIGKICKDKEFMYRVIHKLIATPKTIGFIDPACGPDYQKYVKYKDHAEITEYIEDNFSYPIIVKMNSGSRGVNVFKCMDQLEIEKALKSIFNKNSQYYDYVALAQEYISVTKEYRVVVFKGEVLLVYEKDFSKAKPIRGGNISPLHWVNSKAIWINDKDFYDRVSRFIGGLHQAINVGFAGLDIAVDDRGKMWLLELNTKPGFEYFVRDNGNEQLVRMYRYILTSLKTAS